MSDAGFQYIEGAPYRGKSQWIPMIGIIGQEINPMRRVRLIVPFHTQRPDSGYTDALDDDADRAKANIEVFARYAANDADEAAKLLQAAEALGFRCHYDSGDPHNDDEVGIVTISLTGVAE